MHSFWELFAFHVADYWNATNQATLALKGTVQASTPWLPGAVLSGFTAVNSIRIVAYIPQILKAARDTNGASAISYTTWLLFLASHMMTIAYAIVVVGDLLMAIVFLGNALACLIIVGVAYIKRHRHRRQRRDAAAADAAKLPAE